MNIRAAQFCYLRRIQSSLTGQQWDVPRSGRGHDLGLGFAIGLAYRPGVIGLLRFVGLVNAAVWLGATVFFLFGAQSAAVSPETQSLLGSKSFPFYSVALAQILGVHYFHLYLACCVVALLHLMGEWLYLGKYPRRLWLALVFGLCLAGMLQTYWIQPTLTEWHRVQFTRPDLRENARRAYSTWHGMSEGLNFAVLAGLVLYLWRVANPSEPMRFLSAKLRS